MGIFCLLVCYRVVNALDVIRGKRNDVSQNKSGCVQCFFLAKFCTLARK